MIVSSKPGVIRISISIYTKKTLETYGGIKPLSTLNTRNSSADEIASVNFLYDDIVHALKIQ